MSCTYGTTDLKTLCKSYTYDKMCLFPAFFCAYMTAAMVRLMSVVSKKLPVPTERNEHHPDTQLSLISCVTLSSPMTSSPFSLHYQPARGLSACPLSSSSSFPLRSRPSADCLSLRSPTPRRIAATGDD